VILIYKIDNKNYNPKKLKYKLVIEKPIDCNEYIITYHKLQGNINIDNSTDLIIEYRYFFPFLAIDLLYKNESIIDMIDWGEEKYRDKIYIKRSTD